MILTNGKSLACMGSHRVSAELAQFVSSHGSWQVDAISMLKGPSTMVVASCIT